MQAAGHPHRLLGVARPFVALHSTSSNGSTPIQSTADNSYVKSVKLLLLPNTVQARDPGSLDNAAAIFLP